MNDIVFTFGVLPGFLCFVGLVFTMVFGADILRWYNGQRAVQRKRTIGAVPATEEQLHREAGYTEPAPQMRERELVHH